VEVVSRSTSPRPGGATGPAARSEAAGDPLAPPSAPAPAQAQIQARRGRILGVAAQARQAVQMADFIACCSDVGELPPQDQPGPWTALAGRLAATHASLPDDEALLIRSLVLDGLERLPAGPRSAEKLAAPVLAAFDVTRGMHRRALQPGSVRPAVLAATRPDQWRINQLFRKHVVQALPEPVSQFMEKSFGPAATPADARFALLMLPRRLAELPACTQYRGHVRGTMLRLARHAFSPMGIPSLGEEGWGSHVRSEIERTLGMHGIPVAADVALSDALGGLDALDTLVHVPPLAARAA
jgi:hypothetical protein